MLATVQLVFGSRGAHAMAFAPLTGCDERAAAGAVGLLRRLAVAHDGLVHGAAIDNLTIGDRDRALATLYTQLYGDAVLADAHCGVCRADYEIRFDLSNLARTRQPDGSAEGDPWAVRVGRSRLRLPCIADLQVGPERFLAALTLEGPVPDAQSASAALESADPALELDLTGTCPECAADQVTPFSISRFLEAALQRDLTFLAREVHLIAASYHWSLDEILRLSRRERQTYAQLLIAEREAASTALRRVS
jgi:hypothetical protein